MPQRIQERDDFGDQLRRLHHLRSTEAEKLAADAKKVHEAQLKGLTSVPQDLPIEILTLRSVNDEYIAELKAAPGASGAADSKSSIIQFVHGDVVDEVKRAGEETIAAYKQKLRERDKLIKEKDEKIDELMKAGSFSHYSHDFCV